MAGTVIAEIDQAPASSPTLWWFGHAGFALKYRGMIFYIDPNFGASGSPVDPGDVHHADLILCTHSHGGHMNAETLLPMLGASRRAKVVMPKSAAEHAHSLGIGYERMTTTDAGLRVEYFKNGEYVRVYSVPSAHPELDHTPIGGYPWLGYLIRCGGITIYHAGDCVPYPELAARLKPYSVDLALLPVAGPNNFTAAEAAALAEEIEARWVAPMHASSHDEFLNHMLFHRPAQRFKIFEPGKGWELPKE